MSMAAKLNLTQLRFHLENHLAEILSRKGGRSQFLRIETECGPINIDGWVAAQKFPEKMIWNDQKRDLHIGAVGAIDNLFSNSAAHFEEVYNEINQKLENSEGDIRYLGGFAFDMDTTVTDKWQAFGNFYFVLPRFELVREKDRFYFACNLALETDTKSKLLADFESLSPDIQMLPAEMPFLLGREQIPGKALWENIIRKSLHDIQTGRYEKIVLARETHLRFDQDLNAFQILSRLKHSNPNSIHFCLQPQEGTTFIGGTPELLYTRESDRIYSEAIAGTRRRGRNEAEDKQLEAELLNSIKDRNEHWFVIRNIRDILNDFCKKTENGAKVSVLKLAGVQHLLTSIHGQLKPSINDGQILTGLHPTPAVGGYPTEEALTAMKELEPFRRGWYAAPVGWIARDSAQFAVAIRSGLIAKNNLFLYSGAGIVTGSDPGLEWEEVDTKIANFLRALDINGHIKARYRALTVAEENLV